MKSVVTSVIASADAVGRFPTISDLQAVKGCYQRMAARLEAAEKLNAGIDKVAQEAYEACFKKYPYLTSGEEAGSTRAISF